MPLTATQKCQTLRKKQRASESYGQYHLVPRCYKELSVPVVRRSSAGTHAATSLVQTLKIAELERELARLKTNFQRLIEEREEKRAALLLETRSPSSATLKLWAEKSEPPDDLSSVVEERPW